MKKLILTAVAAYLSAHSLAAPIIATGGNWNSNSTWNLNRTPQNGDTIVIPLTKTVVVTTNEDLNNVVLKVYGNLKFNFGKLKLNNASSVLVYLGGVITGTGSNSEQLRIGNDQIFRGSDGSVLGPQMANVLTNGFIPFSSILPVQFIGFGATLVNGNVLVQWSTSAELNADRFEVEKSMDAVNWTSIGTLAAAGNSSSIKNYSYTDRTISAAVVYYRVKETDKDGKSLYTAVSAVRTGAQNAGVSIASINSRVLLRFPSAIKGRVTVSIIASNGQVVSEETLSSPVGQVILTPRGSLSGAYFVSVSNASGLHTAAQVLL